MSVNPQPVNEGILPRESEILATIDRYRELVRKAQVEQPEQFETISPKVVEEIDANIGTIRASLVESLIPQDSIKSFEQESQNILMLLMALTEEHTYATPEWIGTEIQTPESSAPIKNRLQSLKRTLAKNPRHKYGIGSRRRSGENFRESAYCITTKEETKEEISAQKKIKIADLPKNPTQIPGEARAKLVHRIETSLSTLKPSSTLRKINLQSLLKAVKYGIGVSAEYSWQQAHPAIMKRGGVLENEEMISMRDYVDDFYRLKKQAEKDPEKYGFTVEKEPSAIGMWYPKLLDVELAENPEEKTLPEIENDELLTKKVLDGMRHLTNSETFTKPIVKFLLTHLLRKRLGNQYTTVTEILKSKKAQQLKITNPLLTRIFKKIQEINDEFPSILGFNIEKPDQFRYAIVETEQYEHATPNYKRYSIPPVEISENVPFDYEYFYQEIGAYAKLHNAEASPKIRALMLMAHYSARNKAITSAFIAATLGLDVQQIPHYIKTAKDMCQRYNWDIEINRDEKSQAAYISTPKTCKIYDENPDLHNATCENKAVVTEILREFSMERDELDISEEITHLLDKTPSTRKKHTTAMAEKICPAIQHRLQIRNKDIPHTELIRILREAIRVRLILNDRIRDAARHSQILEQDKKDFMFGYMAKMAALGRPYKTTEIVEAARKEGIELTTQSIQVAHSKSDEINIDDPTILGFEIKELYNDYYMAVLKTKHKRSPVPFVQGFASLPLKVKNDGFSKSDKQFIEETLRTKTKYKTNPVINQLLEDSIRGTAVSSRHISASSGMSLANVRSYVAEIQRILIRHNLPYRLAKFDGHTHAFIPYSKGKTTLDRTSETPTTASENNIKEIKELQELLQELNELKEFFEDAKQTYIIMEFQSEQIKNQLKRALRICTKIKTEPTQQSPQKTLFNTPSPQPQRTTGKTSQALAPLEKEYQIFQRTFRRIVQKTSQIEKGWQS